jgi:hypothetical protein
MHALCGVGQARGVAYLVLLISCLLRLWEKSEELQSLQFGCMLGGEFELISESLLQNSQVQNDGIGIIERWPSSRTGLIVEIDPQSMMGVVPCFDAGTTSQTGTRQLVPGC